MYDEDSYWIAGTRATKGKVEQKSTDDDTIRKLADFRGISTEIRNDYLSMRYTDFLHKYSMRYSKITGSEPVFDWYTDYEGNTYEMGKTNGQKVVLWEIWMQNPHSLPKGSDGRPDYCIQEGRRRKSIFKRALQTSQFTNDHLNPDLILYDAVLWCVSTCVDGFRFPKKELLQQVCNAIARLNTYECRLYTDRRCSLAGRTCLTKTRGRWPQWGKATR